MSPLRDFADRITRLLASGDAEGAGAAVAGVEQSEPSQHAVGSAALAIYRGDAAAARALSQRARSLAPDDPIPLEYEAIAAAALSDGEGAIAAARRSIELGGGSRARTTLAGILLAANRPGEAIVPLKQVLLDEPGNAEATMNLGTAYLKSGDYGEAIACYARAFDANPSDQRPIQNLIAMYAELGKWLGALAALDVSQKGAPPDEVRMILDLTRLHLLKLVAGSYPEKNAAPDPDHAVDEVVAQSGKRPARVRLTVARTLLDLGRLDEARALVAQLTRQPLTDEDRGQVRYLDGVFAERDGKKDQALASYREALSLDPKRADACANALSLLLERGEEGDAEALLATVAPDAAATSPVLAFNQAVLLQRRGRGAEARLQLLRAVRLTRGQGRVGELATQALRALERGEAR